MQIELLEHWIVQFPGNDDVEDAIRGCDTAEGGKHPDGVEHFDAEQRKTREQRKIHHRVGGLEQVSVARRIDVDRKYVQ